MSEPEKLPIELEEHQHVTGKVPENVAIVALGGSRVDFDMSQLAKGESTRFDEIWAVNRGARLHRHDVAWVLDDLEREAFFDPPYGEFLVKHNKPIITTTFYERFAGGGGCYEYPLAQMVAWACAHHVRPYFKNSIPMMVAYAGLIGVKNLFIHGADYTRPDGMQVEPSRANVEYWIAAVESAGMTVGISPNCRLLGRQDFPEEYVYGFDSPHFAQAKVKHGVEAFQAALQVNAQCTQPKL